MEWGTVLQGGGGCLTCFWWSEMFSFVHYALRVCVGVCVSIFNGSRCMLVLKVYQFRGAAWCESFSYWMSVWWLVKPNALLQTIDINTTCCTWRRRGQNWVVCAMKIPHSWSALPATASPHASDLDWDIRIPGNPQATAGSYYICPCKFTKSKICPLCVCIK